MTTVWSILTIAALITAALGFVGLVYPARSITAPMRRGAGVVLAVSVFLVIFALRSTGGQP